MKKAFIHTFSNGDRCTLVLDFSGERGSANAQWENPNKAHRFDQIENEYIEWRRMVFNEFMAGMTFAEQLEVVSKLGK